MDRLGTPTHRPSPRPRLAAALVVLAVAGCTSPGPLADRRTNFGTLKTQVARLEHDKDELKRQVADLETDRRRLEDRLVQEKDLNDDLATRLDDARNLLGRSGAQIGSLRDSSGPDPDADRATPRRTTPAGRSPSRTRKAPFAQMPNEIRPLPEPQSGEGPPPDPFAAPDTSPRRYDDLGPQSRRDEPPLWLPVARGASPGRTAPR